MPASQILSSAITELGSRLMTEKAGDTDGEYIQAQWYVPPLTTAAPSAAGATRLPCHSRGSAKPSVQHCPSRRPSSHLSLLSSEC